VGQYCSRLFTINAVLLAGMAARFSTWSRRICLGNKREWEPVRVSMMEHQPNEVMALLDEAARDPSCEELMLRAAEATDEEFRALITKWLRERAGWRLKE
jgi:hypothetical protein